MLNISNVLFENINKNINCNYFTLNSINNLDIRQL